MTHLSSFAFSALVEQGQFRVPGTMHRTYCRMDVSATQIVADDPSCDDCFMAKAYEEIDARGAII